MGQNQIIAQKSETKSLIKKELVLPKKPKSKSKTKFLFGPFSLFLKESFKKPRKQSFT